MSLPWPHSLCPCHCVVFSDGNSSEPFATVQPLVNNISLIGIIWRQKAWFLQAWNSVLSQSKSHGRNHLSLLPYLSLTIDVHHALVRGLVSTCICSSVQKVVCSRWYYLGPSFWWWLDSVNAVHHLRFSRRSSGRQWLAFWKSGKSPLIIGFHWQHPKLVCLCSQADCQCFLWVDRLGALHHLLPV